MMGRRTIFIDPPRAHSALRARHPLTGQLVKAGAVILMLAWFVWGEARAQEGSQVYSFAFRSIELRAALDSLLRWYRVPLVYRDNDVAEKRVSAQCHDCDFETAVSVIIQEQGLSVKRIGKQYFLQRVTESEQKATYAGIVRDSLTREPIMGADVLLFDLKQRNDADGQETKIVRRVSRWGVTNQFGFFSLRDIRPGLYGLEIHRLGYQPWRDTCVIEPMGVELRDIALLEQTLPHPEVTVEGKRSAFSIAGGISRGFYIRATPTDHNQYLFEGARIYNPVHFGGVMSTFHGDAMRDVQVLAGGVPPAYGGRIGGILDVSLRDGARENLAASAEVGSLASSMMIEGPLSSSSSFIISARQAYPPILLATYRKDKLSDLNTFELAGKLTGRLERDQQLSLSAFLSRDIYGNAVVEASGNRLVNMFRWGNAAANLRWKGILSPSLFSFASLIFTRYAFELDQQISGLAEARFPSTSFIEDITFRAHAEYFYDELHTLIAGVELARHQFGGTVSAFSTQVAPLSLSTSPAWELAVYLQDQWRLSTSVLAEVGARATSFVGKEGSLSAVDPRFSLLALLQNDFRFSTSFTAVTQFVHPYRQSGIFLYYPSIFLYPSTKTVQPTTSLQVSVGLEKRLASDRYRVGLESYYRITQNIHEFRFDSLMVNSLSDAVLHGEGNSYGVELTGEKRIGVVTGSMRYGLSWMFHRFQALKNGAWFTPRFTRRHELYLALSYAPTDAWTLGTTWLLSTNRILPRSVQSVTSPNPSDLSFAETRTSTDYTEPYDLNGNRLPGFQRLEVRLQRKLSLDGVPVFVTLRFLNGYGLLDPFVWRVRGDSDVRLHYNIWLDAPPLFPLYPVISVRAQL